MATERWKLSCTAGVHEFAKSTVPSCSFGWAPAGRGGTRASEPRERPSASNTSHARAMLIVRLRTRAR